MIQADFFSPTDADLDAAVANVILQRLSQDSWLHEALAEGFEDSEASNLDVLRDIVESLFTSSSSLPLLEAELGREVYRAIIAWLTPELDDDTVLLEAERLSQ